MTHTEFMKAALAEAEKAYRKNEVPVGCVAVRDGKIIARGHNLRESLDDPTSHAEIVCIRKAAKKLGDWRLNDVILYVTVKPCKMCKEAIKEARIKKVFHKSSKGGQLLRKFFNDLR
jgi:tRNA(adenine34) deaminase